MIRVSFSSEDSTQDVCELLEYHLTDHTEIEIWLENQIHSIIFECMDYPRDIDAFYDCFFRSEQECQAACLIEKLLLECLSEYSNIHFEVHLVDEQMKVITD